MFHRVFDRVQHQKLIEFFEKFNIDEKNIRCIEILYRNQNTQVKLENDMSNTIWIRRGMRQGCILSPLLFNLHLEAIFREALEDARMGIKVNGV